RVRGAEEDRPPVVRELVEDEPLPRREADAQAPLLPADLVALDREARALGLRDLDRPEIVARGARARTVLAATGRDRDGAVVDDLEHLAAVEVDEPDDALDRPRVAVAVRVRADPRERAAEAAPLVRVVAPRPGRDRVDADKVEVR